MRFMTRRQKLLIFAVLLTSGAALWDVAESVIWHEPRRVPWIIVTSVLVALLWVDARRGTVSARRN